MLMFLTYLIFNVKIYLFLFEAGGFYILIKGSQNFFSTFFISLYYTYTSVKWWAWLELNQRPIGYEPTALTPELQALVVSRVFSSILAMLDTTSLQLTILIARRT